MNRRTKIFTFKSILLLLLLRQLGSSGQPYFVSHLGNLSIALGRDATFKCYVERLGGYRVGWIKADTKAIQAIHDHVITHNPRVSVSHSDHATWNLHIRNVQLEDEGQYMCQVNTDPMKSQTAYLSIVIPPDFNFEETSTDTDVPEGGSVKLMCRATGNPEPFIQWRRENGADISVKEPLGQSSKVTSVPGEYLSLMRISRTDMGPYLCIATNGVPPSISKRIMVTVNFHPVIQVPNQLVGAPLGTNVTMECYVEASPKSINYWVKDPDGMVIPSRKYDVRSYAHSFFQVKMVVVIRNIRRDDMGTYRCIAKNSLGEVESSIRLYEITGPTKYPRKNVRHTTPSPYRNEHGTRIKDRGSLKDRNPARGGTNNRKQSLASVLTTPTSTVASSSLKCTVTYEILYPFLMFIQIIHFDGVW